MLGFVLKLGLGRYSQYRYSIDTDINRYVSIRPSCCIDTDDGDSCKKQGLFRTQNYSFHTSFLYNLKKKVICEKNWPMCFRTSICRIHCIDQSKRFTLFLKSKILDFETLSHVHVYRIEYVSYRQCPYRIRIDTADDRIVPALLLTGLLKSAWNIQLLLSRHYTITRPVNLVA